LYGTLVAVEKVDIVNTADFMQDLLHFRPKDRAGRQISAIGSRMRISEGVMEFLSIIAKWSDGVLKFAFNNTPRMRNHSDTPKLQYLKD